jgi:hypothetical protein
VTNTSLRLFEMATQPKLNAEQLVGLLSPSQQCLQVQWPPTQVLTPGNRHHHVRQGRLVGCLLEGNFRELVGTRAKHPQRWSPEPEHGLEFAIRCPRALRSTSVRRLAAPFEEFYDSDLDHARLAAHLLAHFVALAQPETAELPIYLQAFQNWRSNFRPVQVLRMERDASLAPRLLAHFAHAYRYDLSTVPSSYHHDECNQRAAAPAAQAVRPPGGAVDISLQAGARPPAPLFDKTH